jgi:hypothetical protein
MKALTNTTLVIASILCSSAMSLAQNRVMMNNAVRIVMDGGVFIVVDNANTNAITKLGTTDGIIISDDEDNQVLWEIGTSTGTYTVPFGSTSGLGFAQIPVSVDITGAGTGVGDIRFSTWETAGGASSSNSPWASNVTHLNDALTGTTNNNTYVVDRWWWIAAIGYTAKPTTELTLTYVRNASEIGGSNLLIEANLQGQRFNDGAGLWEVTTGMSGLITGVLTIGTTTGNVSAIPAAGIDFHSAWVLSDNTNALPIELLSFAVSCEGARSKIEWSTATEIDNQFFTILRSFDNVIWEEVAEIPGAANSSSTLNYVAYDNQPADGLIYYRLKQTDFNGQSEMFETAAMEACKSDVFDVAVFNNGQGVIGLGINSTTAEDVTITVNDLSGRIVLQGQASLDEGLNTIDVQSETLSQGLYSITVAGQTSSWSDKILLR